MTTKSPAIVPAAAIRRQFIDYFVERCAHVFVPSSPVVPHDDPTLLFTNAGMNQYKPIFLGQVSPSSDFAKLKRAVNSQKCIRAGGKHNDLDDVGKDLYHHTFFEMLGNWSFGDYFKKEAIDWAWELLTKVWKIDPDRLYATYFEGSKPEGLDPDREAFDLWRKHLPESRILPGNMKDNFWEMGDTGPCGPCSEIHYDGRSAAERAATPGWKLVNAGHPDVIEIWNNVFIQFNRSGPGGSGLRPLPAKHVDTGMGLERVVRVLQGKTSNYDTDLFTPILDAVSRLTGAAPYSGKLNDARDTAYRVVADHARTLTFAITDGAVPSNEGRGYVLRRILRRAFRHARQHLGATGPILSELVPTIVEHFAPSFPELAKQPDRVAAVIREEEEAFARTIDRGIALFDDAAGSKSITAQDAFRLHDTYGFPIDLTQIMAEERGLTVDVPGFEQLMTEAREKSRAAGRASHGAGAGLVLAADQTAALARMNVKPTNDLDKFHARPIRARIRAIWNGHDFDESIDAAATHIDDRFGLVLDKTNVYAEMGGQLADHADIRRETSSARGGAPADFEMEDARSYAGYVLHVGRLKSGRLAVGDEVEIRVDADRRAPIMANHTATHLLNLALRDVLGPGADQKGSLVAPDRLRFDFTSNHPLTDDQPARIESIVRDQIDANLTVYADNAPLAQARKIQGLRAVFGETYPDPVRVVSIGVPVNDLLANPDSPDWASTSIEFCGGTHVPSTSDINAFAILSEEAVAKGVRRITALTGVEAKASIEAGHRVLERLKAASHRPDADLAREVADITTQMDSLTIPLVFRRHAQTAISSLQERLKQADKQAAAGARDHAVNAARALAEKAPPSDRAIIAQLPPDLDRAALLAALDAVRAKRQDAAVMLLTIAESKVVIVAGVPEDLVKKGLKAGDWVRAAAEACDGKGGGRPDSAQGGGNSPEKIQQALAAARDLAASKLR